MLTLGRAFSVLVVIALLATSIALPGGAQAARGDAMRVTKFGLYQRMNFTGTCLPQGSPTLSFPANPMHVYAYGQLAGFSGRHTIRYIWTQTGGSAYFIRVHASPTQSAAKRPLTVPLCDTLTLTGPYPGRWTMRVTVDDLLVKTVHFSIAPM